MSTDTPDRSLSQRLNRDVPTPAPWEQYRLTSTATWGAPPLETRLSINLEMNGSLTARVTIGSFRGSASAEFVDEIPGALRRAYAQAIQDAQGTNSAIEVLRGVAQAPEWLREGLLHAFDQETTDARVEVKRLIHLLGRARHTYDGTAFRFSLLQEVLLGKTPQGRPRWSGLITDSRALESAFDYDVSCGRPYSEALAELEKVLLADGHEGNGGDHRRLIFDCYPGDGRASITEYGAAEGEPPWRVVVQRETTGPVYAEVYLCSTVQEVQAVIAARAVTSRALAPSGDT